MLQVATDAARGAGSPTGLRSRLTEIAESAHLHAAHVETALVAAFEATVEHFLDDGALSESEEQALADYNQSTGLTQAELDGTGAFSRLVRAAALRDILEGRLPARLRVSGELPFNLQKSERLAWVFPETSYYEDRTRREYVGRSQGVSVRIAKGVYYRVGAFKGNPIDTTHRVHVGDGFMGVTTKHLYFVGGAKSLRIRHDKIVSLIPFDDGIGIHRDAATAKPQIFVTGDGWFTYNLLANIAQLEE
jgi:hypothetical protein